MVIVGYYAHGNKHYVAFKDETDATAGVRTAWREET